MKAWMHATKRKLCQSFLRMVFGRFGQQHGLHRAMHNEARIFFNFLRVGQIKMDAMGVECDRGKPKQTRGRHGIAMLKHFVLRHRAFCWGLKGFGIARYTMLWDSRIASPFSPDTSWATVTNAIFPLVPSFMSTFSMVALRVRTSPTCKSCRNSRRPLAHMRRSKPRSGKNVPLPGCPSSPSSSVETTEKKRTNGKAVARYFLCRLALPAKSCKDFRTTLCAYRPVSDKLRPT